MSKVLSIGEKLREARGEKSIEQVAKDNEISISAVSMYENNRRVPRDEVKLKLANYYGASVEALFFA